MLRVALIVAGYASLAAAAVDFATEVQPILRSRCYGCHGAAMQQSGLRLDNSEDGLKGGYSGAVIVPGKPESSSILDRVTGKEGLMAMPPAGKKLTPEQIATLRRWIAEGAVWPKGERKEARKVTLWSFQPIVKPEPPAGAPHPIDAFVRARLSKEGIAPSPEAPRATLLRRLSLDLTGLPPTPEELSAFLADRSPDAYEKQVDRLLASAHYGERMARPWLDIARYADSDGYEKDWVRPWAWRYRHWVINALNRDMPFDQFTIEQVAGDLLPDATIEQRVAAGFHRNTLTNREGGVSQEQFRFENVMDRSTTIAAGWMGMTLGCAQCHDHKYDPLTQRDYYRMAAFFDNVEEVDIDAPLPGERERWDPVAAEWRAKRDGIIAEYKIEEAQAAWEADLLDAYRNPGRRTDWDLGWEVLQTLCEGGDCVKIIKKPAAERTQREKDILQTHFIRSYFYAVGRKPSDALKLPELDKRLRALDAETPLMSQAQSVAEATERRKSHIRVRGDYQNLGIEVTPGVPAALPQIAAASPTRLDLAQWLVSRDNPLTARVVVNRIWQEYFGAGLVVTAEDFGTQGSRPSHPELLDYLAAEFMERGWSMKKLHRLIVTSATYRQSSNARPDLAERDPANVLLARQSRLRLPAESIRDAALAVSGLLNPAVGGKSVKPFQPKGVGELGWANNKWVASEGADQYRRGLYIHFQRTTPYPLLMNFDAPKANAAQCRRQRSNTPLQALNLLNDPVFHEAASSLAERMRAAGGTSEGITRGFLLTVSREPNSGELSRLRSYLDDRLAAQGQEAAWTGLASVLLNLDEFIVRE